MPDYMMILYRAIFSYLALFILTKAMGKREISQMTFFDYVVGITIGSITAILATDLTKDFWTFFPAITVFAIFQILTSTLSLKSKRIRKLLEGSKTALIENGQINERNMVKERINMDELQSNLRQKNVFSLHDVDYAYLETDGKISVMKKKMQQAVTPSDLNIQVKSSGIGHLIIEEGKINETALRNNQLTKSWLLDQLNQQGLQPSEVMFAQVDDQGKVFIDLYQDSK